MTPHFNWMLFWLMLIHPMDSMMHLITVLHTSSQFCNCVIYIIPHIIHLHIFFFIFYFFLALLLPDLWWKRMLLIKFILSVLQHHLYFSSCFLYIRLYKYFKGNGFLDFSWLTCCLYFIAGRPFICCFDTSLLPSLLL